MARAQSICQNAQNTTEGSKIHINLVSTIYIHINFKIACGGNLAGCSWEKL